MPGSLSVNTVYNRLLSLKSSPFYSGVPEASRTPFREYAGTLLAPLDAISVGLQWQHLPPIASGTTNSGAPVYNLFSLNGGIEISSGLRLRAGVDNLFDKAPPITNVNPNPVGLGLAGGGVSANNFDILGRRYYLCFTAKF
ncbi:MAG: hypothetical protein ABIP38_09560 [Steroidobacteraceae bacterium]